MLYQANNPLINCELKFAKSDKGEFEGYGSIFDSIDGIGDTIFKGAFEESISKALPKMFMNHNHNDIPIGDWLKAEEDSTGLFIAGKVDLNHRDGPSAYSAMKRKAMDGLSIGAPMSSIEFKKRNDGGRNITKVSNLMEVSVVTFPMEQGAQIMAVKSEIETIDTLQDIELFLRESGLFSKSTATIFVSRMKEIIRRDAGKPEHEITKNVTDSFVEFIKKL